jgi:alpha-galactosidase
MTDHPSPTVVFIGAGSAVFGPATIYDLLTTVLSDGGTIRLVDTDEASLRRMHRIAEEMAKLLEAPARIGSSTDRTAVLAGADAVIVAAEEDRIERWKVDWEIPHQFGIRHTLGENQIGRASCRERV